MLTERITTLQKNHAECTDKSEACNGTELFARIGQSSECGQWNILFTFKDIFVRKQHEMCGILVVCGFSLEVEGFSL